MYDRGLLEVVMALLRNMFRTYKDHTDEIILAVVAGHELPVP